MESQMRHIYTGTIATRWTDVDHFGIINHAKFMTYMEEIRWQWFNKLGKKLNYILPIVDAHVKYITPIKFPEIVNVELHSEKPSDKSWVWYHRVMTDKLCAEAWITSVCIDPTTNKAILLPDDFRNIIYPTTVTT